MNYEDILSRDNTCFMDIDSQAIAALHNIGMIWFF
jgi:hypothetical protein